MKIIAVDDEKIALESIISKIKKINNDYVLLGFTSPFDAIKHFQSDETADIAFLDINMRSMNGLELAKTVREISPSTKIVFLTGYSEYAVDAFKMHASGYLIKPAGIDEIEREINFAMSNSLSLPETKRIQIRTFGNFDVFVDGKPVQFTRSKSKEILAYLVDKKGTSATLSEIASILWEDGIYDRSRQKQIQTFVSDLIRCLSAAYAGNIVIKNNLGLMIDKSKFDCDYYQFLNGVPSAVNMYCGEYMNAYSWAEFTVGFLNMKSLPDNSDL